MDLTPAVKIALVLLGLVSIVWWLWHEIQIAPFLENDEEFCEGDSK